MTRMHHWFKIATGLCMLLAMAVHGRAQAPVDGWLIAPQPDDAFGFIILHKDTVVMTSLMRGWGPNWTPYVSFRGKEPTIEEEAFVSSGPLKIAGGSLTCAERVWQSGKNAVTWQYDIAAEKEFALTMFCSALSVVGGIEGDLELTSADGSTKTLPFKTGKGSQENVVKAVYRFKQLGALRFSFDPDTNLAFDDSIRVKLAGNVCPAGNRTIRVTATAEGPIRLACKPEDRKSLNTVAAGADWYPLETVADIGPSVIGMENWLHKPAGSRGHLKIVADRLEFADGTPARFWGTNLCYGEIVPTQVIADYAAARFAKYGINCVRLHKFLGTQRRGIGDANDCTKFNPDSLARFDYFTSAMARNGVYYSFSPFFGFEVRPGNKDRLVAYDEIAKLKNAYGLINYAEDVQDLLVEMYTNLLSHKNPHTGKTYAEDPALAAVEIQNEDNILWSALKSVYPKCPTYAKSLEERFADWLKDRYGSDQKLKEAWGDSLQPEESLQQRKVAIQCDPWFSGQAHLPQQTGGYRQRLLDNSAFLHTTQDKYYGKLVKAIREAGYKGPIIGSPWQAPAMLPHYYNLKSDATVGLVDRHNYFSGIERSMLTQPGSGYLGTGLQQVIDRPFSVSEWIHVWPALYAAEGPAIMAVYGLGLQGWDASWQFQSDSTLRTRINKQEVPLAMRPLSGGRAGDRYDVWNVDTPANLGQFPALARMIYRGDVKQGDVISVRQVSDENLATGQFDFGDKVIQSGDRGDVKVITSTVPAAALAAGRVVIEFTGNRPGNSRLPDMSTFEKDKVITSNTGQLKWDYSGKGFFTANTPGTKAAVGFHTGRAIACDNITITPAAQFASIFLTALEPDKTLANCRGALVTAIARQANTNFSYFVDKTPVVRGQPPTLLEPVRARIAIAGRKIAAVNCLNHEGRRVEGKTVAVNGESFTIDTARDKTFYYEVVFGQ